MASATPLSEGIQTPYANINLRRQNAAILNKLLKYRKERAEAEGWEIGEHNCAVVEICYQIPPNAKILSKAFFADSSGGRPDDTSTHAERRAWGIAKAWVTKELESNRIILTGKNIIVSELKACSSNANDCNTYFSNGGGATLGDPESTLVFNPTRGDRFYYTNEGPEQLKDELSSISGKADQKIAAESATIKAIELAQAKRGAKALNVLVEEALSKTSIKKIFTSEGPKSYSLFIETICSSLRTNGNNIPKAVEAAVQQHMKQGGLVFNGKEGGKRVKELKNCLDSKRTGEAIEQEKAPAWGAGPRLGALKETSPPSGTYAAAPPGGWKKPSPGPMTFSRQASLAATGSKGEKIDLKKVVKPPAPTAVPTVDKSEKPKKPKSPSPGGGGSTDD